MDITREGYSILVSDMDSSVGYAVVFELCMFNVHDTGFSTSFLPHFRLPVSPALIVPSNDFYKHGAVS